MVDRTRVPGYHARNVGVCLHCGHKEHAKGCPFVALAEALRTLNQRVPVQEACDG